VKDFDYEPEPVCVDLLALAVLDCILLIVILI
jgi:hypothetical protein